MKKGLNAFVHSIEPGQLKHPVKILRKKPFEKIVGKGENAGYPHLLIYQQCFLLFLKYSSIFEP